MKPSGERVAFSGIEQKIGGLPESIPLEEVADIVAGLNARAGRYYEASCQPTPLVGEAGQGLALFNQANDLSKVARELVKYVPPVPDEVFDAFLEEL